MEWKRYTAEELIECLLHLPDFEVPDEKYPLAKAHPGCIKDAMREGKVTVARLAEATEISESTIKRIRKDASRAKASDAAAILSFLAACEGAPHAEASGIDSVSFSEEKCDLYELHSYCFSYIGAEPIDVMLPKRLMIDFGSQAIEYKLQRELAALAADDLDLHTRRAVFRLLAISMLEEWQDDDWFGVKVARAYLGLIDNQNVIDAWNSLHYAAQNPDSWQSMETAYADLESRNRELSEKVITLNNEITRLKKRVERLSNRAENRGRKN